MAVQALRFSVVFWLYYEGCLQYQTGRPVFSMDYIFTL